MTRLMGSKQAKKVECTTMMEMPACMQMEGMERTFSKVVKTSSEELMREKKWKRKEKQTLKQRIKEMS